AENYKLPYYTISPTYSVCADHGYISGEQWKCPICGKETEVYSRITGYYRPVKNWNAGKSEEFKMRKTYDVTRECDVPDDKKEEGNVAVSATPKEEMPTINEPLLFTSPTCPNCKMAKMILDKAGFHYHNVDAASSKELTLAYGIKQAPTLLVPRGDTYELYENASLIKGFLESSKNN
ncbi:MAG: anaerobic ribonucleoside-triphosphate reductase, partial [bacterium]|nr:anaerobic ribonucleoside-triphosphate reductase [bacterium]